MNSQNPEPPEPSDLPDANDAPPRGEAARQSDAPGDRAEASSQPAGGQRWLLTGLLVLGLGGAAAYAIWAPGPTAIPPSEADSEVGAAATEGQGLGGTVLEVLQVSSYTYLRLGGADGQEFWAAVTKADVSEGQQVRLAGTQLMTKFHSRELDRTFDQIYFGRLAGPGSGQPGVGLHDGGSELPPGHPPLAGDAPGRPDRLAPALEAEKVQVQEVPRAEGEMGHTIEELYAGSGELAGKTIRVRGTVVKLTPGVMGTNFLHIRDATGSPQERTHDLTLKVQSDPPQVGEVATFEGTLAKDVDLGSGYTFPVLVESGHVVGD